MKNVSCCWLLADAISTTMQSSDESQERLVFHYARQLTESFKSIPDEFCGGSLRLAIKAVKDEIRIIEQAEAVKVTSRMGIELHRAVGMILKWPELFSTPPAVLTIKQLDRDGVPHEQIARMYGLVHPQSGRGLANEISDRIDSGQGLDLEHPKIAEHNRKRAVIDAWLKEFPTPLTGEHDHRLLAELTLVPIPESTMSPDARDLFAAGMESSEAAEMLEVSPAEAAAMWATMKAEATSDPNGEMKALRAKLKALGGVIAGNHSRETLLEKIAQLEAKKSHA